MIKPNFVTREDVLELNPFFWQCNKPRGLIIDTNFFYLICDDLGIFRRATHRRERILDNSKVGKILYWKIKSIKTFDTFLIQNFNFRLHLSVRDSTRASNALLSTLVIQQNASKWILIEGVRILCNSAYASFISFLDFKRNRL